MRILPIDEMHTEEAIYAESQGALTRIRNILDTPSCVTDNEGYVIFTNRAHEHAQTFIRNHLDSDGFPTDDWLTDELRSLNTEYADATQLNFAPESDWTFTRIHATKILRDLALLWADEYRRDDLSHIAMKLSLCPMHFCDWASCFDDEDEECAQIRSIFPHHHDT